MTMEDFLQLCEAKLSECKDASNAPWPMPPSEGRVYMKGRADILQWVLEMLPPDTTAPTGNSTIADRLRAYVGPHVLYPKVHVALLLEAAVEIDRARGAQT